MKKLTQTVKVVSRSGSYALLTGIDLTSGTVSVTDGRGPREISFATIVGYKLAEDNAQAGKTLTKEILTGILAAQNLLKEPKVKEPKVKEPKEPKAKKHDETNVPYGTISTTRPNTDETLYYAPDLATKIGCTQKNLRKRLRKLEALGFIVKTSHTWCWTADALETVVAMLADKLDGSDDPYNPDSND